VGGRGSGGHGARSSGREGRVYIRRGSREDGMDLEEDEDATALLQLELSLRAIADIGGGG